MTLLGKICLELGEERRAARLSPGRNTFAWGTDIGCSCSRVSTPTETLTLEVIDAF